MRFSFATRPQHAGTEVKQRSAGRWMTERAAPRTSRFQHKNPRQTWRLTRGTTQESKSWHHRLHEGRKRDGCRATAGERLTVGRLQRADQRPSLPGQADQCWVHRLRLLHLLLSRSHHHHTLRSSPDVLQSRCGVVAALNHSLLQGVCTPRPSAKQRARHRHNHVSDRH
jgi:hypothetical protein